MKINKADVKGEQFRVWCDTCSIRIAPNEEQIAVEGKTDHKRCYAKTKTFSRNTQSRA